MTQPVADAVITDARQRVAAGAPGCRRMGGGPPEHVPTATEVTALFPGTPRAGVEAGEAAAAIAGGSFTAAWAIVPTDRLAACGRVRAKVCRPPDARHRRGVLSALSRQGSRPRPRATQKARVDRAVNLAGAGHRAGVRLRPNPDTSARIAHRLGGPAAPTGGSTRSQETQTALDASRAFARARRDTHA